MANSTLEGTLTLPNLVVLDSLLTNSTTALTGISLPKLTTVMNNIQLSSANITTLDLPVLFDAGFGLILDLPALRSWTGTDSVGHAFEITINEHNISSLSFPSLRNVLFISVNYNSPRGSLYLNGTAWPQVLVTGYNDTIFISELESLDRTRIQGCNNITILASSIYSLEIDLNPYLKAFEATNLVSLGTDVLPEYITTIPPIPDAPSSLVPEDVLFIAGNPQLGLLAFPFLMTIQGSMQIMDNDVQTIEGFNALRNVTSDIVISGAIEASEIPLK
jgi:hypothetical protein